MSGNTPPSYEFPEYCMVDTDVYDHRIRILLESELREIDVAFSVKQSVLKAQFDEQCTILEANKRAALEKKKTEFEELINHIIHTRKQHKPPTEVSSWNFHYLWS